MKFVYFSVVFNILKFNTINSQNILNSPYGKVSDICPTKSGQIISVNNFPSSPFKINPFKDDFKNPDILNHKDKVCREDKHCIYSYEMNIEDIQLKPFNNIIPECSKLPGTWVLAYNGKVPGPTIIMPTGHESLVRFNNKISVTRYFKNQYNPCLPNNKRSGRPISVHLHGSASLAPYDGWAEDETCFGETKDYVYPNFRSGTGWYHDHALHITAHNAYYGLAGMYFITAKKSIGGCGEPWNLDNIEERHLILNDKVLDSKCQLYSDIHKQHKDDLYGDINLVSGIPFPNMKLDAKWYRFRLLNAAVSRPYLLKIVDEQNKEISSTICKIIAADGGFRDEPADFPTSGLLIGVAERYEVVCDFSKLKNKVLYLYNFKDDKKMKDVPYFCYSHLVAKLIISNNDKNNVPFIYNPVPRGQVNIMTKVLSQDDINKALTMINDGQAHRTFDFGRSNGHWTINGESWNTMKLAAEDVGQNTWELWKFKTGGGWFHPVHIHLIDFLMLKRDGDFGIQPYEYLSPKDVLYLAPSNTIWTIARFGAHKGDYMFHCHNLIHEDDDMMRAMRIINGEKGKNKDTAEQYIINPLNNIIYNNWKYSDPMLGDTAAKKSNLVPVFNNNYVTDTLSKNLYRIFYPLPVDLELTKNYTNPWQSKWC
jgi:FtsP/CotA-like multicopper oxidase with cupredoxin domain